jgi:hypothetical protein
MIISTKMVSVFILGPLFSLVNLGIIEDLWKTWGKFCVDFVLSFLPSCS